ncbi:putative ferric reductase [Streptococcus rupicaprae]|uniref:Ferric reductase n=1 Tax=Streptococcus rupicaprae TaxID=759619 RepID=A0ABV2FLB9_9STRE
MLNTHKFSVWIAWLTAVFLIPFPFIYTYVNGLEAMFESQKLGVAYGIIAYVWMLLAIYIGTRPRWIDRYIGLPAAYMIHGILSLVAILFSFFHKNMNPSFGLVQMTGNVAFMIFLSLALYSTVFMAGWLTSRVPVLGKLKRSLETVFKHEVSVWLHRLNILATFLIFVHVQLIDYIRANTSFMAVFWLTSVFVFGTYLYSKIKPTAKGYTSKLLSNRAIGDNIHELRIALPSKKLAKSIRPGDFVFISFPSYKGLTEPHPFSAVNHPAEDQGELVLAIRGDGDFTKGLQLVPAHAEVFVTAGYGMYQTVIDDQAPGKLIAISGGIGITPILSIIEGNQHIPTSVFYGASTPNNLLYQEKFAEWNKRDNFKSQLIIGPVPAADVVADLPENKKDVTVLISGPAVMARYWIKVLTKQGVPRGRIFYEEFGW